MVPSFDASVLLPAQDRVRGQFGDIVTDENQWLAVSLENRVQLSHGKIALQRRVSHERQALSGEVIDDHQHHETPSFREHGRDEVQAPALVGGVRQRHGSPPVVSPAVV